MKLYAIKWQGKEIGENDWFKSLGCAISDITHFDGRVVASINTGLRGSITGTIFTIAKDTTHAGKTGMELKLWWAVNKPATVENCTFTNSAKTAADLLKRALPLLSDTADKYEDDGSNEPLELIRDIGRHLAEGGAA